MASRGARSPRVSAIHAAAGVFSYSAATFSIETPASRIAVSSSSIFLVSPFLTKTRAACVAVTSTPLAMENTRAKNASSSGLRYHHAPSSNVGPYTLSSTACTRSR